MQDFVPRRCIFFANLRTNAPRLFTAVPSAGLWTNHAGRCAGNDDAMNFPLNLSDAEGRITPMEHNFAFFFNFFRFVLAFFIFFL